jgi:NADPH:quinone reductase-like Zn-dependent oxidoreductase
MSSTHPAVVTVVPSAPLELHQVPTPTPEPHEVKLIVHYTASTPLDLHQASAHLLVTPPQILGDGVAGTVLEVGAAVTNLKVGDHVFGFTFRGNREKAHQLICVADARLLGKIPEGWSMQECVVLGNNFVTAWHTLTADFGFELPWPKEEQYVPKESDDWILVWGGSSSVGMYAIQLLKWYGYKNIIAVAGKGHHKRLVEYGARSCFDYRDADVVNRIRGFVEHNGSEIKHLLDCIGSLKGSTDPLAKIANAGAKVAVLLPVIVRDAEDGVKGEYSMNVESSASWAQGVEAVGVRTHFYLNNPFLANKLQTEIMPAVLRMGIIKPNDIVVVEGETVLQRAEKALGMLRNKEVSGARLVWAVAEKQEIDKLTS